MFIGSSLNQSSNENSSNRGGGNRGGGNQGRSNNKRRRSRNRRPTPPKEPEYPLITHTPKRYGVVFFKRVSDAKLDLEALLEKAKEVDQLNIVIRAEPEGVDDELTKYGKVFAGEAWTLIHERRVEDGWYNEPQ